MFSNGLDVLYNECTNKNMGYFKEYSSVTKNCLVLYVSIFSVIQHLSLNAK